MNKRIVICGGSGLIGKELSRHLTELGYVVQTVTRTPHANEFGWDQLAEILDGCYAVINLSGRSIACKFSEQNKADILASRLDTAKLVDEAIGRCQIKPVKWINASATGFYGDRGDEVLNEESAPGSNFSAKTCVAWENACLLSSAETKKTVVRTGVVLSRQGGILSNLIPITKAFLGGQAGHGKQWISWIHLHDIVQVFTWIVENDAPPIVIGCTNNPIQNADFAAWLRLICGRPWSPPIPAFVLQVIGKLVGPDASLVLDSYRVIPPDLPGLTLKYPVLTSIKMSDLS